MGCLGNVCGRCARNSLPVPARNCSLPGPMPTPWGLRPARRPRNALPSSSIDRVLPPPVKLTGPTNPQTMSVLPLTRSGRGCMRHPRTRRSWWRTVDGMSEARRSGDRTGELGEPPCASRQPRQRTILRASLRCDPAVKSRSCRWRAAFCEPAVLAAANWGGSCWRPTEARCLGD